MKCWVWMRFDAMDADVTKMLRDMGAEKVEQPPGTIRQTIAQSLSANERYDGLDKRRVRWEETERIAKPEVYTFFCTPPLNSTASNPWTWHGNVIVDKERHHVYVHALGD